jgi:hypothetical protein
MACDTQIFALEGHEIGLALPGVVPLATAKANTNFTQPAERPRMSTVRRWCGGLNARNRGLRAGATSSARPFFGKVISEIGLLPVMYLQGLSLPTVLD